MEIIVSKKLKQGIAGNEKGLIYPNFYIDYTLMWLITFIVSE